MVVLLDRIADVYPALDLSEYPWDAGYRNSHGGSNRGKALGRIWECSVSRCLSSSYDAAFDALVKKQSPNALEFIARSRGRNSYSEIIDHIEEALVRKVFDYVQEGQIRGNMGMHHASLGLAAVILNEKKTAERWLEWLYAPGKEKREATPRVTGGDLENVLINKVDRDGMGDEAAPNYNSIWLRDLLKLADALEESEVSDRFRLFEHPVFRKMFFPYGRIIMSRRYIPSIADSGKCGDPGFGRVGAIIDFHALEGFSRYRSRELARLAVFLHQNERGPDHLDIFSDNPMKPYEEALEIVKGYGEFELRSINLSGYGLAVLRDRADTKDPQSEWDAWIYYGRTFGHGHRDSLTLGLHAFGLDLMPDLGNPEHKNYFTRKTHEWFKNTVNHNTVVVDESMQEHIYGGFPRYFHSGEAVNVVDIESPGAYPATSLYRRSIIMMKVDTSNFYLVDFFRIRGGSSHHFSFHGAEGAIADTSLQTVPQKTGTYAGPDVTYGILYDAGDSTIPMYKGSGFHYLDSVERAKQPESPCYAEWKIEDTWNVLDNPVDVRLRLTMLTSLHEAAFADGKPAQNYPGNPKKLRYLLAKRTGDDLESHYVSVIEPYIESRSIRRITRLSVRWEKSDAQIGCGSCDAAAVRVDLIDGSVDYIVSSLFPDDVLIVEDGIRIAGAYAAIRVRDGIPEHHTLVAGTLLEYGGKNLAGRSYGNVTGVVTDFTRDLTTNNAITVELDRGFDSILEVLEKELIEHGGYIYVENDRYRAAQKREIPWSDVDAFPTYQYAYADLYNAVFEIKGLSAATGNRIVVDIGDTTLIRRFKDSDDHQSGYSYVIAEGDRFYVPLSTVSASRRRASK